MSRLAVSASVFLVLVAVLPAASQQSNTLVRESSVTATVDRIERSSRVVTFRGEGNTFQSLYIDPSVKAFDELRVGDRVTVRYIDSTIVKVRPDAKPSELRDLTEEARKAGNENVVLQSQAVVTVESVDPEGLFVGYVTPDNMHAIRKAADKKLLEGLRPGDRVEITWTRERAVSIEHVRR